MNIIIKEEDAKDVTEERKNELNDSNSLLLRYSSSFYNGL